MTPTKEQVLEQCKQAVAASNANGLQVLALIAGVIRQVAPSPVALPETAAVVESPVALPETAAVVESPVALPETAAVVESPVALPETSVAETPSVESVALPETEPPQAQEPAYRFVLNVPEIKDYKDVK